MAHYGNGVWSEEDRRDREEDHKYWILKAKEARRKASKRAREIARARNVPAGPLVQSMVADCDYLDPRLCTDCAKPIENDRWGMTCMPCLKATPGFGQ